MLSLTHLVDVGQWFSWQLHQFPFRSLASSSLTHEPGRSLILWPRAPASFVDFLNYQSQIIGWLEAGKDQNSLWLILMNSSLSLSSPMSYLSFLPKCLSPWLRPTTNHRGNTHTASWNLTPIINPIFQIIDSNSFLLHRILIQCLIDKTIIYI